MLISEKISDVTLEKKTSYMFISTRLGIYFRKPRKAGSKLEGLYEKDAKSGGKGGCEPVRSSVDAARIRVTDRAPLSIRP